MPDLRTAKVSKTISLPGYIVDEDLLKRVDKLESEIIAGSDAGEQVAISRYLITRKRDVVEFKSSDRLLADLNESPVDIRSVSVRRTLHRESGIDVVFSNDGEIRVSGFSDNSDFQFNVERLHELLLSSSEEQSWVVRALVGLRPRYRLLLSTLLLLLSFLLLFSVFYYAYATRVGVDIDPGLIPRGNEYLQKAADALKSNDVNTKLNALLLAQLSGFENVSDVLARTRRSIIIYLAGIFVIATLLLVRKLLERLYPRAFFLFGQNRRSYSSLQSKRQIWGVAIVIGFLVNVAAGLAIAIMMR